MIHLKIDTWICKYSCCCLYLFFLYVTLKLNSWHHFHKHIVFFSLLTWYTKKCLFFKTHLLEFTKWFKIHFYRSLCLYLNILSVKVHQFFIFVVVVAVVIHLKIYFRFRIKKDELFKKWFIFVWQSFYVKNIKFFSFDYMLIWSL